MAVVLLGGYVALLGALVHRHRDVVAGVTWPWGLVLALVTTGAVAWAIREGVIAGRRHVPAVAWFALGWTLMLFVQPFVSAGDQLVAGDWLGWTYTAGGLGVLGVVTWRDPRVGR